MIQFGIKIEEASIKRIKIYRSNNLIRINIVCFYSLQNNFKMSLLETCFCPLIRNVFFPSSIDMVSHTASSPAHALVFDSDTICNNSSLPLVVIVRFGPLRIAVSLTIFVTIQAHH